MTCSLRLVRLTARVRVRVSVRVRVRVTVRVMVRGRVRVRGRGRGSDVLLAPEVGLGFASEVGLGSG